MSVMIKGLLKLHEDYHAHFQPLLCSPSYTAVFQPLCLYICVCMGLA